MRVSGANLAAHIDDDSKEHLMTVFEYCSNEASYCSGSCCEPMEHLKTQACNIQQCCKKL